MVAAQTNRESSESGEALQPAGGSCLMAFRSDIRRSWAAVLFIMEENASKIKVRRVVQWNTQSSHGNTIRKSFEVN